MKTKNKLISIAIVIFSLISITSCDNNKINENLSDSINNGGQAYQNNICEDIQKDDVDINDNNEELEQETDEWLKKETEENKYNKINVVSVKELNGNYKKYMDNYVKVEGTIDYIDEKEIICEMILTDGSEFIEIEYYDTTDYFKGDYISIEGIVAGSDNSHTYNKKPILMTTIEATKIGNIDSSETTNQVDIASTDLTLEANLVEGFVFAKSDKEKLTYTQINSLDNYSLKVARNEIFARHGYAFKSLDLKKYFGERDWYESNADYKGQLNSIETYNVNLILKEESSR